MMKRGWMYQATGYTILSSFLLVLVAVIFIPIPNENRELFHLIIGLIEGAFVGNLVNHFFGSSQNKQEKVDDNPNP